ncbi:MAG TPA: ATP-binding protein [Candidatus Binatia bacterium]|jgi:signal transduction histidine kinase/HAMP domain-containing protein
MSRLSLSSLRARLLLLVLTAAIPAFGLIVYIAWEQRQSAAAEAKEKTLKVARDAVEMQKQLINDAGQMLSTLARQPEVMATGGSTCFVFMANQLRRHSRYRNLGVIDLEGRLRCSAVPFESSSNLADRLYFLKAVETRDFSIGEYQIGRVTGKATVAFGYPLLDGSRKLRGVLFAALDLEWLNRLLVQSQLSPGSVVIVVDQNGTVLAHSTEPEKWVGKSLPQVPIVRVILTEQREGTVEAPGMDGVDRLYAFTTLPVAGANRTYIGVGIPTVAAYSEAHRNLFRNVVFLGIVAVLALAAAWFGSDLFVLRQVNALVEATRRFAYGDLYGRTRLAHTTGELHELAQSFDAMGVALHAREMELRGSKEQVQHHLERIRALHEINLAINSTLDLRTISDVLLEKVYCFFSCPTAATIRLLNKATGGLEPLACWNLEESAWRTDRENSGRGLTDVVAKTKKFLVVEEIDADPRTQDREFFRRNNLVSYLGVPLVAKGELLGVLSIYTEGRHRFTDEEIEFLTTLGGQAAIAINNSRLYEQIKNRAVESDKANKLKGEFLSVMSHELRTPLAVAMGYAGMVKEGVLGVINSQQQEALEKVLRRGHDQLYMINSILYASSLEAQAVKVERHNVSLSEILDDLRSTYAVITEKKIALVWDYPADLPMIKTDVRKLRHILENLINNAIKFTENGTVTISGRCLAEAKTVQFEVTDTGIGISRDLLPLVFDIFRQVDGSEKRLQNGVGLGLYIVKKFTELLGGEVKVESEFGKGSTFSVTIPYEKTEQTGPTTQTRRPLIRAA